MDIDKTTSQPTHADHSTGNYISATLFTVIKQHNVHTQKLLDAGDWNPSATVVTAHDHTTRESYTQTYINIYKFSPCSQLQTSIFTWKFHMYIFCHMYLKCIRLEGRTCYQQKGMLGDGRLRPYTM